MASIPGVRFDITGASGSQGLLGPKSSWRCYVLPRGAHASQDSTGTLITFDTADAASRFTAGQWIQVGLSTANLRQISSVAGNSLSVSGSAVTVSENDRVFLIGNTQPTVTGGSATYTTPDTKIRKRDDNSADLYTNSMVTSDSNGLIQFWSEPESGPGVGPQFFDCIIQDGDQSNQASIIDLEVGAGDARAGWIVTAYPVGAVVSAAGVSTNIDVDPGHSFRVNDTFILGTSETTFRTVSAVDVDTVTYTGTTFSVAVADKLTNLGPDTGSGTPNYDGSHMAIYSDPDFGTRITGSSVAIDSNGAATFWHKGDGAFWKLIRNLQGAPQEVVPGNLHGNRFNIADYGAIGDGSTNDAAAIQAACTAAGNFNGIVFVPQGTFLVADGTSINGQSQTILMGTGNKSILTKSASMSAPLYLLNAAANCRVTQVAMHANSSSNQNGLIELQGACTDIEVDHCELYDGYSAVWAKQGIGIVIHNNKIYDLSHPIYLGNNSADENFVDQVRITENNIQTSVSAADCIKTVQNVRDATIANNWLHGAQGDGIDMYAEAKNVMILGNTIEGNAINGIDIKADNTDSLQREATHSVAIVGNVVRGNSNFGINIDKANNADWNYAISVADNIISGNSYDGVFCQMPYTVIANNQIFGNGLDTSANYRGIYLLGTAGESLTNAVVANNMVFNNGETTKTNPGINVNTCANVTLMGNVLSNDSTVAGFSSGPAAVQDWGLSIADSVGTRLIANTFDSSLTLAISKNAASTIIAQGNVGIGNGEDVLQFDNADDTPDVSGGFSNYQLATTGASITNFTNGTEGQVLRLLAVGTDTVLLDAGNFVLNGNWSPSANQSITLIYFNSKWFELGRSDN